MIRGKSKAYLICTAGLTGRLRPGPDYPRIQLMVGCCMTWTWTSRGKTHCWDPINVVGKVPSQKIYKCIYHLHPIWHCEEMKQSPARNLLRTFKNCKIPHKELCFLLSIVSVSLIYAIYASNLLHASSNSKKSSKTVQPTCFGQAQTLCVLPRLPRYMQWSMECFHLQHFGC